MLEENVLSHLPIHAQKLPKMGLEGVMSSLFGFETCLEHQNLLWKNKQLRASHGMHFLIITIT